MKTCIDIVIWRNIYPNSFKSWTDESTTTGVLQRHESLAANLGAKLVGPLLLKSFEVSQIRIQTSLRIPSPGSRASAYRLKIPETLERN